MVYVDFHSNHTYLFRARCIHSIWGGRGFVQHGRSNIIRRIFFVIFVDSYCLAYDTMKSLWSGDCRGKGKRKEKKKRQVKHLSG